ncbi:MAG: hypothetical protein Kow0010_27680 [Dehalococcoidia bacterium]
MTEDTGTARDAAERNATAVMAGNLAQVMADITPQALQQMMQLGSGGDLTPQSMPTITGYHIDEMGSDGDTELFHVTFESPAGTATLATRWAQVMGQWKIVEIGLVSAQRAEGPPAK